MWNIATSICTHIPSFIILHEREKEKINNIQGQSRSQWPSFDSHDTLPSLDVPTYEVWWSSMKSKKYYNNNVLESIFPGDQMSEYRSQWPIFEANAIYTPSTLSKWGHINLFCENLRLKFVQDKISKLHVCHSYYWGNSQNILLPKKTRTVIRIIPPASDKRAQFP